MSIYARLSVTAQISKSTQTGAPSRGGGRKIFPKKGKILMEDLIKIRKNREEFLEGIGKNFVGWPEYISLDLGYEP